jgi:ketosteroid isomerase-like protein
VSEGREFAARMYAAVNARDRGAIRALTASDIVVGTTVEAFRGPEALLEWLDDGDDAFDNFTVDLLDVEELDGHVVVSMRQRGRGKASGADVDDRITHVWTLRDGQATRLQSFAHHDDAVHYVRRRTTVGMGATLGRGPEPEPVLRSAYQAFNDRDIETALELMHPDVDWPNAWEGGRVRGRAAVREYWARQFAAISSDVQPERFTSEPDGSVTVDVHQVVRDARTHELLSDSHVRHRYRLETGLILRMDVLPA